MLGQLKRHRKRIRGRPQRGLEVDKEEGARQAKIAMAKMMLENEISIEAILKDIGLLIEDLG